MLANIKFYKEEHSVPDTYFKPRSVSKSATVCCIIFSTPIQKIKLKVEKRRNDLNHFLIDN